MGIGLVLFLIGGVMAAWGYATVEDAGESLEENEWALEGVTSGTIEIVDDDGEGEIGFSIFIEGTYTDDNADGTWDFCEPYDWNADPPQDFTTTHTDESENSFWYVCDSDDDWNMDSREEGDKTLVQIGNSALGYTNGTATISCATACWVQYDDKAFVGALEDVGEAIGGLGGILGSTCFFVGGCCLLLLGLILGLTINDKSQTVVVQGGGGGMVGMGAPVAGAPGGAVPMMGAPVAAAEPMAAPVAAAPVVAAPVAEPNPAQEYYNGLLSQGYDATSAAQYTAQHYPGFQP